MQGRPERPEVPPPRGGRASAPRAGSQGGEATITRALDFLNRRGKGWACRLIQLTGKASHPIHPKHLIEQPRAWFLDRLKAGDHVLDLGCGTGSHGLAAATVAHVTFCDKAFVRATAIWFPGPCVQADLEAPLPFEDRSFDAVLMLDVLEHLDNRVQAILEVQRILTPAGLLFLAVPNAETAWRRRLRQAGLFPFSDPDHRMEYSRKQLVGFLDLAGFQIQSIAPVAALDTPWAGLIDLVGGLHLPTYRRLVAWKRRRALENPEESTGFLVVARPRRNGIP